MNNKIRLFLAINISQEARDYLEEFKGRWYDFPGKWTSPEKLHVTVAFLGNVASEFVPALADELGSTVAVHAPFFLDVTTIDFAHDDVSGRSSPRMVWAYIGESGCLSALYHDVRTSLEKLPFTVHPQRPHLRSHITLNRFNSMHLARWHGDELPPLKEEINISFPVTSIELVESKLRRGGSEFNVLQSFMLTDRADTERVLTS